jgi:hypothetical protein
VEGWRLIPILSRCADANDAKFFACRRESARVTIESAVGKTVRWRGLRAVPFE